MQTENRDLTGQWDGTFAYPDVPEAGPTTPFLASISDSGGLLKGEVIEPNEYREGTANSSILGQRIGRSVHFSKTYHGAGWEYSETVLYYGTVAGDGNSVTGEWRIDHWRGPFEMTRVNEANIATQHKAAAEVMTGQP